MKKFLLAFCFLLAAPASFASQGLVIHTTEMGVGKFHRQDNKVHAYEATNAWKPYVMPEGASTDKTFSQKNADGSYTIFFNSLDDMMKMAIQISSQTGEKVSVLNVHGHGLPGGMWFPKNQAELASWGCSDWKDAATGSDDDNYNQYYSAVSVDEIQQIRDMSDNPNVNMPCTTGVSQWQEIASANPTFKTILAQDAQIHFLSCVVGLGQRGENFTKGIANLLLPSGKGLVETSMDFGLGDWSMPEGMGFWDYQTQEQVDHDNSLYTVNHKDREIAQKGTIRMASSNGNDWVSSLLGNRDFMTLGFETSVQGTRMIEPKHAPYMGPMPTRIRVPGTKAYVSVQAD